MYIEEVVSSQRVQLPGGTFFYFYVLLLVIYSFKLIGFPSLSRPPLLVTATSFSPATTNGLCKYKRLHSPHHPDTITIPHLHPVLENFTEREEIHPLVNPNSALVTMGPRLTLPLKRSL